MQAARSDLNGKVVAASQCDHVVRRTDRARRVQDFAILVKTDCCGAQPLTFKGFRHSNDDVVRWIELRGPG